MAPLQTTKLFCNDNLMHLHAHRTHTQEETLNTGFSRLVPDFAIVTVTLQKELSSALLEGKVATNKVFQIWDDRTILGKPLIRWDFLFGFLADIAVNLVMIGQVMKLALDFILMLSPGDEVCVVGILVRGVFDLI